MRFFNSGDSGYTRGGLDVESAINLFFKGVLLFPIFLFAGYIGLMMMKHMIMHGLPVMNNATPEQQESIRERDSQIGLPSSQSGSSESVVRGGESVSQVPQSVVRPGEEDVYAIANNAYAADMKVWRVEYKRFTDCGGQCMEYPNQPVYGSYFE